MLSVLAVAVVFVFVILCMSAQLQEIRRLHRDVHRNDDFLQKLQREHHDLRRQFLMLEIDFIVLQERSK